ncbi:MAG: YqgE/AlgH family protein [Marinospirillum sp.]|uniref:YqgE/AlgH family protein n=1 Tax=Marinospirillum sp. TaxID=2183934 RepID=UPI0019FEC85A|nr:YqgE/AlgH family protein [Marinospirillum sp.]MBE0505109.1 YqgE/AlgH family protein [Marinospirillum sp.]
MNTLRDHFLLAMPQLDDAHFGGSLTYLCEQNDQGALGLIINKPLPLTFGELMEQMSLPLLDVAHISTPIYRGGPVHGDRGFVLHTGKSDWKACLPVSEHLSLTTSLDILEAISANKGPEHFLIALGCAGWDAGQLEKELLDNAWLTCPASEEILYGLAAENRLAAAAASLGINLELMTRQVGHA